MHLQDRHLRDRHLQDRYSSGPRRSGRRVSVSALALALAVPGAALADSHASGARRSYRQTPAAYSPRFDTPIAPGVDLSGFSSAAGGHVANSDVMTVDLTHPGVSTGVLSNRVTDVAPVGGWAQRFGAVAAINGDYFDIGASQAPIGAVVRNGKLQKGSRAGQSMTGMGTDGALRTTTVYLDGTVSWGRSPAHALDLYNSDLSGSSMPRNGLAILDGGWGASALHFVHAPKKVAVVTVVNGKVAKTTTKLGRITVPAHGFLLVGTGTYQGIAGLAKGTVVKDTVGMHNDSAYPFSWGLGAGLLLMRNGSVIHNYPDDSDPHDARTALGWKDGGHTMIVLTVEYGDGSIGQGVNEIADEMAAQGATDAVLLDGGGSTTLVARQQGDPASNQIGPVATPGDVQRRVPIGIGVFVPKGSGLLDGFDVGLDAGAVFPGLHREVTYKGYDEWYGAANVDPAKVTLATDNDGLLQADGIGLVQALRPGAGHVTATSPTSAPGSPGTATSGVYLKVLDPLTALFTPGAMRLLPGGTTSYSPVGTDADGDTAPILASDVSVGYDSGLLTVSPAADGSLTIAAKTVPEGQVTPLTLTVAGVSSTIVVHIGFATVPIVDPGRAGALHVSGGSGKVVSLGGGVIGLKVAPTGTTASAVVSSPQALPTGSARVGVTVAGDGQRHALGIVIARADGSQQKIALGTVSATAAKRYEVAVPSGATLLAVTVGKAGGRHGGSAVITQVVART